jgi:hypothetical protein
MKKKWIWITPLAIVGVVLFITVGGAVVMFLWNWLLPGLFGWPRLGFWQALGLLALCRILFGGLGRGGSGGRTRSRVRRRMAERWERLTPEEREAFGRRSRERCRGFEPSDAEARDAEPTE